MNTQSTVEQMQHLKLFGMSKLYQAVLEQPLHQQPEAQYPYGNACRCRKPVSADSENTALYTAVQT